MKLRKCSEILSVNVRSAALTVCVLFSFKEEEIAAVSNIYCCS
jgi:hypothetical protein